MSAVTLEPLSRRLSEEADHYLEEVLKDDSPEEGIRESAFGRDLRPLGIISAFDDELKRLQGAGAMGVDEYAVAASFYRDLRVLAGKRGLLEVFRVAFFRESRFRCRMLLVSPDLKSKSAGAIYALWGLTSCYGTSPLRWLLSGVVLLVLFTLLLVSTGETGLGLPEAALWSVETFSQSAYSVESVGMAVRLALLAERLIGMVFLIFGFSLLLPQLSLELARTTASTRTKSRYGTQNETKKE